MAVSLVVLQPSPRSSTSTEAREYWEDTLRRRTEESPGEAPHERSEKRGGETREEEKTIPPKKIDAVGDEAYWSGSRFGGALYVLRGNIIIRISVGGADNEETKIEKSKMLAQKALGRLP
jgi:hypothetical protein